MSNLQQVAREDEIQLAPMLEEICTDLAPLAEKRNITLECSGDAAMIGSDALIYRLLFNLTENAIKYNHSGGKVTVKISQTKALSAAHSKPTDYALVEVTDTGIGISPEFQEKIFDPFFRVDKSRSRAMGGAGLGLALVNEIARQHGGQVKVLESSEKGSTIALIIPNTDSMMSELN